MLRRVYADNFRCLVNFEFKPGQLNLLLGENGSGKTTLFEVLATMSDFVSRGSQIGSLTAFTRTAWDNREVQRFEMDIEGGGGAYRYSMEVQHSVHSPQSPVLRFEEVAFNGGALYRFSDGRAQLFDDEHKPGPTFPFRGEQSYLWNLDPSSGRLGWFKRFMEGIKLLQLNPFQMDVASREDQVFLNRYGKNFASWMRYLTEERPAAKAACETRLREALPGFESFVYQRRGDEKLLLAEFRGPDARAYKLNLLELSEGQRAIAILYAVVFGLLGETSVLCLDEPDNFVSLPEVQPWLQTLRDILEERGGQALVISHHPEVIDYLSSDAVFRFERPTGPAIARPFEVPATDDLKVSEVLARGG